MPVPPWLIADNGVRNPKRLKDGLRVLVNSEYHGNFSSENEEGMALLLDKEGVITLQTNQDNTIARKWRLNLIRLGFVSPKTHTVTENGRRLLHSNSLPAEEECFLRALLAHQIPSSIHGEGEQRWKGIKPFSPLRMVLEIICKLGKNNEIPEITQNELASIVILHHNMNDIDNIVNEIVEYRSQRIRAGNKRKFDRDIREHAATKHGRISATSLRSYADVNIRYLKLTGLFAEDGKKLSIAIHKEEIVRQILSQPYIPIPKNEYESKLATGALLPTDDEHEAINAINNTYSLLVQNGEVLENLPDLKSLSIRDLSQLRLELENDWIHVLEQRYSEKQMDNWRDIFKYLQALQNPRGSGIIPSGEAPVYLEWAIWRAFLAINYLENYPWEARRFTVDRSFLPVRHAPGGGPDMVFEYEDYVLVVEVTLTSSSRQEAAEGEPVRRHVAQYFDHYDALGKRVYGLFIANNIDTNTAETFRIGVWYRADDSEIALQIVPITLSDFTRLFKAICNNKMGERAIEMMRKTLDTILSYGNERAPQWKKRVKEIIDREIEAI